jgi:hypothetical protein
VSAVDPLRNRLPADPLDRDNALANAIDSLSVHVASVEAKIDGLRDELDQVDKRNLTRTIGILCTTGAAIVLLLVDIILRGAGGA